MRVAYLLEAFPVVSQTFLLNQVRGLIERGHEVEVYADWLEPSHEWIAEPLRSKIRSAMRDDPPIHSSRLRRVASACRLVTTAAPGERGRLLRAMNTGRFGAEAISLRLLHLAARLSRGSHFDAIRGCFGQNGVRALMLRSVGLVSGPIATSFHGFDLSEDAGHLRHRYPDLFRNGELMLPTSDAHARTLVSRGCPPERVVVLPSAIDTHLFRPPEEPPPSTPFRVVSIGRLVEKKGFIHGIRAVARAAASGVAFHYTIAGDGPLRPTLEAEASRLGLTAQIRFTGAIPPPQVCNLLRQSHVLLAPSIATSGGDLDSRINVIKEAFACAVPAIATRHGGIPELVRDGESGVLVPEGDVEGMSLALKVLAADDQRRASMGARGYQSVARTYDVESLTLKLESILTSLRPRDGERNTK